MKLFDFLFGKKSTPEVKEEKDEIVEEIENVIDLSDDVQATVTPEDSDACRQHQDPAYADLMVEQDKSDEDVDYITGLTFTSDERGILCHGHSLLEKLSVHPIGEGMQWIGDSHGPLYFANCFTGKARQLLDENSHLVGFRDQDFDWEKLKKVEHPYDLNHRHVDYGGLGRYWDFRDGVCCLCWMLYPDGRYFADEDGYGMEDNAEENIYCIIDKYLRIVIPWQPMTDEEMAEKMREAREKVMGK